MSWHRPNSTAGKITSPFGKRGPIPGAPNASTNHLGVDLRAGTAGVSNDIYAVTAGTVRRIYKTPLGAWVLELDHGGGVRTRYAHMQRAGIAVTVGAKVAGGQRVAAASNSGAPTVHLHFEVLIDGVQVDPVPYLRARGIDLTTTTVAKPGGGTGSITTPTIPGAPAPITPEDDLTPDQDARLARIEAALSVPGQPYMYPAAIVGQLTNVLDRLINIADDVRAVRGAQQVPGQPFDYAPATHNAIARLIGDVAALQGAVAHVAAGTGADPAAIAAAARQGAADALAGITITVTAEGDPA
ncbi:M23 family metallopeptidase [Oerskovia enterophila]|uniref:Stage II sporulation protein Q n=1 Tax=Oerskovia enterophila TaxID=43678 RepID=A0A163QUV6_9CELL|nr:M23 family metallopeptidase [Oerskovia enterophila]KZM34556.1 stage II sporulation protein Q [Oerskovia enterophila]